MFLRRNNLVLIDIWQIRRRRGWRIWCWWAMPCYSCFSLSWVCLFVALVCLLLFAFERRLERTRMEENGDERDPCQPQAAYCGSRVSYGGYIWGVGSLNQRIWSLIIVIWYDMSGCFSHFFKGLLCNLHQALHDERATLMDLYLYESGQKSGKVEIKKCWLKYILHLHRQAWTSHHQLIFGFASVW